MYDILFVEDDPAIGYILAGYKIWEALGFRLKDTAENGRAAWDKMAHQPYDLVITDIRMPVMDGLELIRAIKKMPSAPEVVLASTYSEFEYAKEGIRLGVLDYIEKPFSELKLEGALKITKKLLDEKKQELPAVQHLSEAVRTQQATYEQQLKMAQAMAGHLEWGSVLDSIWRSLIREHPWLSQVASSPAAQATEQQFAIELSALNMLVQKYRLHLQDQTIKACCTLLVEQIGGNGKTDIIAAQLAMSRDYLAKLFKLKTGMTLHKYFQILKMERAKKLLRETKLKIYEVGDSLGYRTVDYFAKLFREYTGLTPTQYKQKFM